ncbi:Retrovirus-related Pol polyprotein from transposon RE1 [Vitis vinifera]|uniref:Retrovirus-related Pol polyprotein from transposon RE1 n=1 Tax=Vitis vinifera TaxID=29760 RepID=A0A438HFL2_VITVI|nr:Retrovirus-related Pol polyprotein from transposon RE1 [Vitis vinifera]
MASTSVSSSPNADPSPSCSLAQSGLSFGRTIGMACECEGLYRFDDREVVQGQAAVACSNVLSFPFDHEIMLWHYRLGHPSFPYLSTSEIMPESGLDNSSSPSHSSLPIDLVPSDLDLPIALRKEIPKNVKEAYGDPRWKVAVVEEVKALEKNGTWELVTLPKAARHKNAFLNRELEEEVYMDVPPRLEQGSSNKVCQLKKALYGHKQSPQAWFKSTNEGKITVLMVYVDDLILTGNDHVEIEDLKKILAKEFEVKDLGALRKRGCLVNISIDSRHKIDLAEKGDPVDKERYQQLVGKLIYLSHTRLDIAFAVAQSVSQYMHSPYETHMNVVYKMLQYLKEILGKALHFGRHDQFKIEALTNADWAGSIEDRRSTSSYCTFVFGNLITWRSKKQNVVARSSARSWNL